MEMLNTFTTLLSFFIIFSATQCLDEHKTQLSQDSSLSVEKSDQDFLISSNQVFTAGFHRVGRNAFCFAIWFTNSADHTVAWMANRDQPVNGRYSQLKLMDNGDIHLIDAKRSTPVWSSNTISTSLVKLILLDTGNLVLRNTSSEFPLWQSFDFPTTTLLPSQLMTRDISLISSTSPSNHSSGFYKFFFDNDNVLRLLFDGPEISSIYWPDPMIPPFASGRTTYNDSRVAWYDSFGHFSSSDNLGFYSSDFGFGPQRRLTLDFDGSIRLYSLQENGGWEITWLATWRRCALHGCGPNSLCEYVPNSGRRYSCLPGFKLRSSTNWVLGCESEFNPKDGPQEVEFVIFNNTEFYGYDIYPYDNMTIEMCEDFCRKSKACKAFSFKLEGSAYTCYPKAQLLNGFNSLRFRGTLYLKMPKNHSISLEKFQTHLNCDGSKKEVILSRNYETRHKQGPLKFLLVFVSSLGVVELLCIFLVWCFLFRTYEDSSVALQLQGCVLALTGFKRYSYVELRKATSNFREEIGRGGSGIVYKGTLPNGKLIAIKKLNDAEQGEAGFLAEVNTIGRLKHMNLIELLGYCLDGKKRLLVIEFMENRSLAENISSNCLSWEKRFEIALGTAKGLAYLHEECLEWVLHCDVKPQNILLDSEYQPKVADFGLSKFVKRDGSQNSNFSRIRGTRGYMAPEWASNLPITSKVDVYSYGVVMLEIVTGKSSIKMEQQGLVTWVKEMKNATTPLESWIEEIADSALEGNYNIREIKTLALVAMQCVEEDRDARPTMSQVVDMLQI